MNLKSKFPLIFRTGGSNIYSKILQNCSNGEGNGEDPNSNFRPLESNTCTADAAVSIPATAPPKTRPSAPARETYKLLVLLCSPLFSDSCISPDSDMISNWPCGAK
jgi:hypothetical protein